MSNNQLNVLEISETFENTRKKLVSNIIKQLSGSIYNGARIIFKIRIKLGILASFEDHNFGVFALFEWVWCQLNKKTLAF